MWLPFIIGLFWVAPTVYSQSGDYLIDHIIEILTTDKFISNEIDPASIGNFEYSIFTGKNITLYNLSAMKRSGHSNWTFSEDYSEMKLVANVGVRDVTFFMYFEIRTFISNIEGTIEGLAEDVLTEMIITSSTDPVQPKLTHFDFVRLNGLRITEVTSQYSFLNGVIKFIGNGILTLFKSKVVKILREKTIVVIEDNMDMLADIVQKSM